MLFHFLEAVHLLWYHPGHSLGELVPAAGLGYVSGMYQMKHYHWCLPWSVYRCQHPVLVFSFACFRLQWLPSVSHLPEVLRHAAHHSPLVLSSLAAADSVSLCFLYPVNCEMSMFTNLQINFDKKFSVSNEIHCEIKLGTSILILYKINTMWHVGSVTRAYFLQLTHDYRAGQNRLRPSTNPCSVPTSPREDLFVTNCSGVPQES